MVNKKKILILGGGFAGVAAARELHRLFGAREADIKIINKTGRFVFTPWLPEVAVGGLETDSIAEKLNDLLPERVEVIEAEVKEIDFAKKEVKTELSTQENFWGYDYLVVALGAITNDFGIRGVREYAWSLKTLAEAEKIRKKWKTGKGSIVVVGGGPTGVELAVLLKEKSDKKEVYLIQKGNSILGNLSKESQKKALAVLTERGVRVELNARVEEVTKTAVELEGGRKIESNLIIWTAGVKSSGQLMLCEKFKCDGMGRVSVEPTLNLAEHKEVFVVGDVAELRQDNNQAIPMLAQAAEREGQAAARNIFESSRGKNPEIFKYKHKGFFIPLGKKMALLEYGKIKISGRIVGWIWWIFYIMKLPTIRQQLKVVKNIVLK